MSSSETSSAALRSTTGVQKIKKATSYLGSLKETTFLTAPGSCHLRCRWSQAQEVPLQHCGKMASWSRGDMLRLAVSWCQTNAEPAIPATNSWGGDYQLVCRSMSFASGSPVPTRCGSPCVINFLPFDSWCLDKFMQPKTHMNTIWILVRTFHCFPKFSRFSILFGEAWTRALRITTSRIWVSARLARLRQCTPRSETGGFFGWCGLIRATIHRVWWMEVHYPML